MTQKEYREVLKVLNGIRDALASGAELRTKLQLKYPTEDEACKGLSEAQKSAAAEVSNEIEELWSKRGA